MSANLDKPQTNKKRLPICDYEGSDYQESFWEKGGRQYEDQVEEIALQRLMPVSGKLMLELGAGAGRNTLRYRGFDQIVLLDYSMTQLQQAQERLGSDGQFIYVAADIYQLPFVPGLFDTATMIRTLHHMADASQAIAQVRQAMQPGGNFILEYPNKRNIKAILRYLLRRQSWSPFSLEPIEFVELNYNFHPKSIREWLGENGFQVERQITVSHFRIGILKRIVPLRLLVGMDSLAQLTGDYWQLTPSLFVHAKAVGDTEVAKPGTFFRCPDCCHYPLVHEEDGYSCSKCSHRWGIQNGVYDFRKPVNG